MAHDEPNEAVLQIDCGSDRLPGMLTTPPAQTACSNTAILVIVGGPQYRVGSHRQFVHLARALAREGHVVLRFDYRGVGDAPGSARTFEDAGPDLHAAIDAAMHAHANVRRVVLWGLCDAASLALMHGARHPHVAGMVLANPWVRSPASLAAATVKRYYVRRALEPDFWRRLFTGRFDWRASARSIAENIARMLPLRTARPAEGQCYQTRMALGLAGFEGPVLLLLSGNDMTAQEFVEYAAGASEWKGLLTAARISRIDLRSADHTFSTRRWKDDVARHTHTWIAGHLG